MKLLQIILCAALLFGAFVAGRWTNLSPAQVIETVRIDTVFYRMPTPEPTAWRTVTVNVPRILFAPASGQGKYRPGVPAEVDPTGGGRDSVRMELVIETQQYADSTYRAQVSGPAVGTYRPQIDWIEIYARERTRTSLVRKPYSWEVGPATGAWLSTDGRGAWIGVQARRNFGRLSLSATGGWATGGGAYGQVVVGVNLFRR